MVTLACSPGEAATSEFHITEARQLLPSIVRYLLPQPLIMIEAPAFVETVVTLDGNTLRVHCIARVEPPAALPATGRPAVLPTMMEDTPLFRVRVQCQDTLKSAIAFSDKTNLVRERPIVTALIEDVHEVLVLELGPRTK